MFFLSIRTIYVHLQTNVMNMKKHIPNCITLLNLFSGCVGVIMAFHKQFDYALLCMLLSAVFDFCDGMAARALKAYSNIGKELDSLADVVSFGFLPGMLAFQLLHASSLTDTCQTLPYLAFIITLFSALRLAKFNVDERQTTGFIGLATPANALFWGSLAATYKEFITTHPYLLVVLCIVMAYLLVAELPFFSLKFKNLHWKENKTRFLFLIGCVPLLVIFTKGAFVWIIAWYILLAIITNIMTKKAA